MRTLIIALDQGLLVARMTGGGWDSETVVGITSPRALAVDRAGSGRVYCGTAEQGVHVSDDGGRTWRPAGDGITEREVTAIAVVPDEGGASSVVYAGTGPSALYRSSDGGERWARVEGLNDLPSSGDWSFPPRPYTHHVRWIEPDPIEEGRLYIAIEAGALVQAIHGGKQWLDRVPGGPYDTHTLATHPNAPRRLYSAAGDGYFESRDGGASWSRPMEGLSHRYLVGLALDPADPDLRIVSGATSPRHAYNAGIAESYLYRKQGNEAWQRLTMGLPEPRGMTINIPATHPSEAGTFYTTNNHGAFRSVDGGERWTRLPVPWPDAFLQQRVHALIVI